MGVAVVTGASRGIGRAVAHTLARSGWDVVVAARSRNDLDTLADELRDSRGSALVVPVDVADETSVRDLFAATEQHFERLDLLFNNAGVFGPVAPIDEVALADWQQTVAVNLTGPWLCARAAFALMKRQQPRGGRIINNGSLSAQVPRPHAAAYTATKHAITGLTRSLALEGRPFDIVCGQIDIGNAASSMMDHAAVGMLQADGEVRPEPVMDVQHVADAVLYMAGLPLSANVQFLTVLASAMPYVGRG